MNNTTTPVLRVQDCYLITVMAELSDTDVQELQSALVARLWREPARGVILDVSALEIVDSYVARVFDDIGVSAAAMGTHTVLVGLRPAVAITLVEMGVELTHLSVDLDVDSAMDRLRQMPKAGRAKARLRPLSEADRAAVRERLAGGGSSLQGPPAQQRRQLAQAQALADLERRRQRTQPMAVGHGAPDPSEGGAPCSKR